MYLREARSLASLRWEEGPRNKDCHGQTRQNINIGHNDGLKLLKFKVSSSVDGLQKSLSNNQAAACSGCHYEVEQPSAAELFTPAMFLTPPMSLSR